MTPDDQMELGLPDQRCASCGQAFPPRVDADGSRLCAGCDERSRDQEQRFRTDPPMPWERGR